MAEVGLRRSWPSAPLRLQSGMPPETSAPSSVPPGFRPPVVVAGLAAPAWSPASIEAVMPGVSVVSREPLETGGYSAAWFERVGVEGPEGARSWVLKRMDVRDDWFSRGTHDPVGREAQFVASPLLGSVAPRLASPYLAVDTGTEGLSALLMHDLGPDLLPDERAPLAADMEAQILTCLAGMHADHWGRLAPYDWLMRPQDFLTVMGPHSRGVAGLGSRGIRDAVIGGWERVLEILPPLVADALRRPPEQVAVPMADLPRTLVHGDVKVANFAALPDGRVCALDWAFVGWAPATFDLGWYLAVNASRLAGSREDVIARYRVALERALGTPIDEVLWARLEEAAVVCGAFMLLWSKVRGAEERGGEWDWWVDRLERWAHQIVTP